MRLFLNGFTSPCTLLSFALIACGGSDIYSFTNEGTIFLESNPDGTLEAGVVFPACLSSTCDTVLETRCDISVDGSNIVMTSYGSYATPKYGSCSSDCRLLIAYCASADPLAPGVYDLVHGDNQGSVTLPTPCIELFGSSAYDCDFFLDPPVE
jgi:hypothetical protein